MKRLVLFLMIVGFAISLPIVANGQKVIKIDCNSVPELPDKTSWKIDNFKESGTFIFNPETVTLLPLSGPNNREEASTFAKKAEQSPCYGNVLDYLIEHQELIPESWRNKTIVFTGTVYIDPSGNKLFKNMIYSNGLWEWNRCYFNESYNNCASIISN